MHPLSTFENDLWEDEAPPAIVRPVLGAWVRVALVAITLGIILVFAVAVNLNPYRDGRIWLQGTHTQMGLPSCSFKVMTKGFPCPSCGMTSSFALLVRGDVWNSLQANAAGTLLAVMCLVYVPWSLITVFRGRALGIASIESAFVRLLVAFLVLMLLRWVIVISVMIL